MRLFPILLSVLALCAAPSRGAETAAEPDALELSISENLDTPAVPAKARAYVRTSMDQLRRSLLKHNYDVVATRDGEVLEVTIPARSLFAAGATALKPSGTKLLQRIGALATEPSKYKIIIAAHADDTGDEAYADSITAARANAIDDLFWQISGQQDTNTVPYGLGRDEPRVPNTTRANREINRRIEIYIVPDYGLLEMAGVKRKTPKK